MPSSDRALTVLLLNSAGLLAGSTQSTISLGLFLRARGHRALLGARAGSVLHERGRDAGLESPPLDFGTTRALAAGVRELMSRERVDVVNSQDSRDRRACTWLRWRSALPEAFVVTRRTMPLTWPPELLAIGSTADRTIAVSEAVQRALVGRGHPRSPLRIVPNGIDLARVDAPPSEAAERAAALAVEGLDGRAVVLVVARRKDQHILLKALQRVQHPVALVCAGIEADDVLRPLADRLPARHMVRFLGLVQEPLPLYRHAQLTALPSRIEGLSQTLLEAMALGVPAVGSAAGGNPELLRHNETGWLVPPLDVEGWATTIDRVLGDSGHRTTVGAAGRRLVREQFTLAHTAARTELVYREALAARRRMPSRMVDERADTA